MHSLNSFSTKKLLDAWISLPKRTHHVASMKLVWDMKSKLDFQPYTCFQHCHQHMFRMDAATTKLTRYPDPV